MSSGQQNLASGVGRGRRGWLLVATLAASETTAYGVLAWAQVSDLAVFYAIWVGIGLTMAAVLYEPAFAVIASWYRDARERNRALLGLTAEVL